MYERSRKNCGRDMMKKMRKVGEAGRQREKPQSNSCLYEELGSAKTD